VADEVFSPDYTNHGGLIPDLVRGPEAIKISVALYRIAFPTFASLWPTSARIEGRWWSTGRPIATRSV